MKTRRLQLPMSSLTLDSTKRRIREQSSSAREAGSDARHISREEFMFVEKGHVLFHWNTVTSRSIPKQIWTIWKEVLLTISGTFMMVHISRRLTQLWRRPPRKFMFHWDLTICGQMCRRPCVKRSIGTAAAMNNWRTHVTSCTAVWSKFRRSHC